MIRLLRGHVLDRLAELAAESVHCCVTSPPYFGLRDYKTEPQLWPDGWLGSIGVEPTPELYIRHLVEVFREVRRVLRKDGTLWLNIGDSYANSGHQTPSMAKSTLGKKPGEKGCHMPQPYKKIPNGVKPKDLLMIPAQLALALRADGWYLRSEIIWTKRSPMPESVTDRPTQAHEKVFLLTKSARYFYDAEAVKEPSSWARENNPDWQYQRARTNEQKHPTNRNAKNGGFTEWSVDKGRNLRNVWHLGPEPFPEAHFATFPTEIPRRAILAGTSDRGVCLKCGAPWARITNVSRIDTRPNISSKYGSAAEDIRRTGEGNVAFGLARRTEATVKTIGWQPTCLCNAANPIPATVLDPFFGSGTTGLVADQLQRDSIGIDLSADYVQMAKHRIRNDAPLFVEISLTEGAR